MKVEILTFEQFKARYPRARIPSSAGPLDYMLVTDGLLDSSYPDRLKAQAAADRVYREAYMQEYIEKDIDYLYKRMRNAYQCTPEDFKSAVKAALLEI